MKVNIIGMGEIGKAIYDSFPKDTNIIGTEKNKKRLKQLKKQGYCIKNKIDYKSDVCIIAVYSTRDVLDILQEIASNKEKPNLISIESTINPHYVDYIKKYYRDLNVLLFPHRYNPNDLFHMVFNLDRVMGAFSQETLSKGLDFYSKYMNIKFIHVFPVEIVALAKPMENFYRFCEIVLAQQIKKMCDSKELNFNLLRKAMNTKWNISMKEARNGVEGKCLPKDTNIISQYFEDKFSKYIEKLNEDYKEEYGR